ncbi:uncharacterized protein LOC111126705 [Crassostrea virginica]
MNVLELLVLSTIFFSILLPNNNIIEGATSLLDTSNNSNADVLCALCQSIHGVGSPQCSSICIGGRFSFSKTAGRSTQVQQRSREINQQQSLSVGETNHTARSGVNSNQQRRSGANTNQQQRPGANTNQQQRSGANSNQQQRSGANTNQQQRSGANTNQQQRSVSNNNQQHRSRTNTNQQQRSGANAIKQQRSGSNANPQQRFVSNRNQQQRSGSNIEQQRQSKCAACRVKHKLFSRRCDLLCKENRLNKLE